MLYLIINPIWEAPEKSNLSIKFFAWIGGFDGSISFLKVKGELCTLTGVASFDGQL